MYVQCGAVHKFQNEGALVEVGPLAPTHRELHSSLSSLQKERRVGKGMKNAKREMRVDEWGYRWRLFQKERNEMRKQFSSSVAKGAKGKKRKEGGRIRTINQ